MSAYAACTYLVMGAVSYNVNDKEHKNMAKVMIIERIKKHLHIRNLDIRTIRISVSTASPYIRFLKKTVP